MIEGMEILNKTEIMEKVYPTWIGPTMIVIFAVCILLGIIGTIYSGDPDVLGSCFLFGFFLCGFVATFGSGFRKEIPTSRYRYEATISEDVSFRAIYEKYDVIEVRGDIYILEDK